MLGNAGILPRLEMDTCFARFAGCGLERTVPFLRKLAPWLIILTTMFGNGGVFCWFSYVTPQMLHEAVPTGKSDMDYDAGRIGDDYR